MIRDLIEEEQIDVLGIIESKHKKVTRFDILSCWGNQDVDWTDVPANEGGLGGLILT